MEIKKWEDGQLFEQNGGHMRWVFWPGCGYNALTLHYSVLYPGESFHMHDHLYSEDVISVIRRDVAVCESKRTAWLQKYRRCADDYHRFSKPGGSWTVRAGRLRIRKTEQLMPAKRKAGAEILRQEEVR